MFISIHYCKLSSTADCNIDSPHLGLHKKLVSSPVLCGGQVQEEGVAHLVQVCSDTTLIQVTYLVRWKVGRIEIMYMVFRLRVYD